MIKQRTCFSMVHFPKWICRQYLKERRLVNLLSDPPLVVDSDFGVSFRGCTGKPKSHQQILHTVVSLIRTTAALGCSDCQKCNLLWHASERLKPVSHSKERGRLSEGVLLLHDNARHHTAASTLETSGNWSGKSRNIPLTAQIWPQLIFTF
jgi:hypothetical protein